MINLNYNADGLIPAIIQDAESGAVLMLAYMNAESLAKTIAEGKTCFFSRSRQRLWTKGEESGHFQYVRDVSDILVDCDADTLLIKVKQVGPACHTNSPTCFYRDINDTPADNAPSLGDADTWMSVYNIISDRVINPKEGSYTNYLFEKGLDKMLKKVGEETAEVIIAAKNRSADEVRYEAADLLYHLAVVLKEIGLTPNDIYRELEKRK